jgi:hypothetical protein
MRKLWPWIAAVLVLIALWPSVCVSQVIGEPTSCESVLLLPLPSLPLGGSAATWGSVIAVAAALATYFGLRKVLRRSGSKAP